MKRGADLPYGLLVVIGVDCMVACFDRIHKTLFFMKYTTKSIVGETDFEERKRRGFLKNTEFAVYG